VVAVASLMEPTIIHHRSDAHPLSHAFRLRDLKGHLSEPVSGVSRHARVVSRRLEPGLQAKLTSDETGLQIHPMKRDQPDNESGKI
jgi:hypothetical protein